MLTLFLDTGSHENLLALCTEKETLATSPLPSHGDMELVPAIERILKESGHSYQDLTNLAAVLGPGGFTSLRVGIAAINALSYALDIPSAGIHLSDLWAPLVLSDHHFLWLHSTRRTQIFIKKCGAHDASIEILSLDEAEKLKGEYIGELIPEHQTLLTLCRPMGTENIASLTEILPHLLLPLPYGKKELELWYGRGKD